MSEEEKRELFKEHKGLVIYYDTYVKVKEYYKLHQENTQLKKEKDDFIKTIIELQYEIVDLKSVLKEIRELVESYNLGKYDYSIPPNGISDLLEIIDKAGIGEDNG